MEEKYLRHKPLPIDDAARKRVKDLINQYASRSEGHPFGNYGDQKGDGVPAIARERQLTLTADAAARFLIDPS